MSALPAHCLAAVMTAPGVTEIREFPLPAVTPTTGILKLEVSGVCGADWNFYNHLFMSHGPMILGHEAVGFIADAGAEALTRWGLKEGDRVALEEYVPCGHCEFCRGGEFRHCQATEWRRGGLRYGATEITRAPALWGGYSQYQHLHPTTVFHRVPDGLEGRYASLALPAANGVEWTYLQGKAGPGDTVVVQGVGQQGLSCVVAAKEAGASRIIVTGKSTPSDKLRMEFAKRLGADHVVNVETEDLLETLADLTGGHMADLVVDCTGNEQGVAAAFQIARKCGRVVLGGQLKKKMSAFDVDRIIGNFLTVRGMRGHSYQAVELAMQLINRDAHHIREMSSRVFGLAETDLAIRTIAGAVPEPALHCCVDPWR